MKFAIVHNWPGQRNSELELILRIKNTSAKLGHECTVVDPLGHPLTDSGQHNDTVKFIDARNYDFCLHLHYVNPNFFDTFSYAVNWNPLDYIVRNPINGNDLPIDHVAYRTFCLSSHHMLLSAGSDEMDDFANAINSNGLIAPLFHNLRLHTTCEVHENLNFPDFNRFKVFYIGANWEKQQGINRHGGIIERLDATNHFEFYGIKKQNGIHLWEGINNYKGELPFDGGKSILERSNECGVSLVIHSKAHRDSGLVSTRIFQACAAKTLTICDNNPFILKHFGDSVLSFTPSIDPEVNFNQIMEKLRWIRNNPDQALEKTKQAHQIFTDEFSLQKEMSNIFEVHNRNKNRYVKYLQTENLENNVDVLYFDNQKTNKQLRKFFKILSMQTGVKTRAVIFTDEKNIGEINKVADLFQIECKPISGFKKVNDGIPLEGYMVAEYLKGIDLRDCFAVYNDNCRWHQCHLAQLLKLLDGSHSVSMASVFVKNSKFFDLLDEYYMIAMESIGTHCKGITENDLGQFKANKFCPSAFLFKTHDFINIEFYKALRFFDAGWAFFLVLTNYLETERLPVIFHKLSVELSVDGQSFEANPYLNSRQSESFESSLAFTFLKNNPKFLTLVENSNTSNMNTSERFSINRRMQFLLGKRPILLKLYRMLFRLVCTLLKLPYCEFASE